MTAVLATAPKALWYLTRGTGAVSFLLLTASVVLGILHSVRWAPGHTPRFVVHDLHRNISLMVIVFIVIHVATAVVDGFAPIRWLDAIVPFSSAYRTAWLGLGAVAFDVLLAVVVTSLLRSRMGFHVWKGIHWAAYGSWAIAIFHGLGVGSDTRQTWMLGLVAGSVIIVAVATTWRVATGWSTWDRARVALATGVVMVPLSIVAFLLLGPLRVGRAHVVTATASQASSARATGTARLVSVVLPAQAHLAGTADVQPSGADGSVTISGRATTSGPVTLGIRLRAEGTQTADGVSIGSGALSIVPPGGAAPYRGPVAGISEGGGLVARLADGHGDLISVSLDVVMSPSGSFSGDLAIRGLTNASPPRSGDSE
jgi:sulfoxide reductase heme-binding subunit YedZ